MKDSIEETNKLIAEFMGKDVLYNNMIVAETGLCTVMLYDVSYDWLMPVVEKIKSEEIYYPLAGNGMYYVLDLKIDEALITVKIEAVYKAVIQFIQWYNQQPKTV